MPKTPEEIAAELKAKADQAEVERLAAEKAAADAVNGFPSGTEVAAMSQEQQTAYWKYQSRKHENAVKSHADYDDLKAKASELEQLKAASASDEEKAREEARREGEVIGAEKYLKDAVKAHFRASTGKTVDEVDSAFEHVDAQSFTDSSGGIDVSKIDAFAANFGTKSAGGQQQNPPSDPVREALERQRAGGGGGGGGSIAALKEAAKERLTAGKK